jgi:hypothetical protein
MEEIKLDYSYDLKTAKFEQDVLQQEMLQFYLRADRKFRMAYNLDYTPKFVQFLRDKARLKEPISISCMGSTRGGKSYSMISIAWLMNYYQKRIMDAKYICGNALDFMDRLKQMQEDELMNSAFIVDEDKQSLFGQGSTAKKMKLLDISNIIAINNISTISICPTKFPRAESSSYGVRAFGRDFTQKVNRFMLYNLQEGERGSIRPLSMVYIPTFTKMLPKEISEKLEKEYLVKKNQWVMNEMRSTGDTFAELKKRIARIFFNDEIFNKITKKQEKLAYITAKLGGEYTKAEVDEILSMSNLYKQGFLTE